MPEWLNGAVSKTVVVHPGHRGFESHPLRQSEDESDGPPARGLVSLAWPSARRLTSPIHQRMPTSKPRTVAEYIAASPAEGQGKLHELRAVLRAVAPHATEALKWGMPVFEEGRILFAYAAFKSHLNFMPTPSAMKPFAEELASYTTGKGSIQIPYDKPLPKSLIRKIATFRVKEVKERDARWM